MALDYLRTTTEVKAMLIRLIDFLTGKQITTMFVNLTSGGGPREQTDIGVSSLTGTGSALSPPAFVDLAVHEVKVEGEDVLVRLSEEL